KDMATERGIREWFSEQLISSGSIRLQVIKEKDVSGGLDNALIGKLIDAYLVRRDDRSGVTWFELAHDRLVQPIIESNRHWFTKQLAPVQRQAKSWDEQGRPDSLLLQGRELREARRWAKNNSVIIRPVEEELIRKSVTKRNRTFWKFGAIGILLVMVAVAIWLDWQNKRKIVVESMKSELKSARFLIDSERYKDATEVLDGEIFKQLKDDLSPGDSEKKNLMQWYLELVSGKPEAILSIGPQPPLYTVAQSPDGKYLAVGGEQGTLLLYNIETGKVVEDFSKDHRSDFVIYSIVFDPKNKWFAYAGTEKRITIRSLEPDSLGEILTCWATEYQVFSLAVDPEGEYIASGGGDSREMPDKPDKKWEKICRPKPEPVTSHGSPKKHQRDVTSVGPRHDNNKNLDNICLVKNKAFGIKDPTPVHAISIWNVTEALNGSDVLQPEKKLTGHCNNIAAFGGMVFSLDPDKKRLVSAEEQGVVYIWDWKKGVMENRTRVCETTISGIALNDDGTLLATTGGDKNIRLLSIPSLKPEGLLVGHKDRLYGVSFANDGKWLLSSGHDAAIRIWDRASGVTQRIVEGHGSAINNFLIASQEQKLFSVGDDGTLRRWEGMNTPNQTSILLDNCTASAVAIASNDNIAVGCSEGILMRYSRKGTGQDWEKQWKQPEKHRGGITRLDVSSDGLWLSSVGPDKKIYISRMSDGSTVQSLPAKSRANAISFSPDGNLLAAAGENGQIFLFIRKAPGDNFTEHSIIDAHEGQVSSVTFDIEGQRLVSAGRGDRMSKVWDLKPFPPSRLTTHQAMQDSVSWAAFSPDGRKIARVGRTRTVEFIDAVPENNGAPHSMSCYGHGDLITKVVFTPTGHHVITCSADATVRVWNLETCRQLFTIPLPAKPYETGVTNLTQVTDFDFRCSEFGSLLAVSLIRGKIMLYNLDGYLKFTKNNY
ncbi:MAG: hypothetical protein D3925_12580, partial [Candidatus Electrothrix sp. AR5]|nr:hypothetical protein [Candidatus Electrothrix sp. AR5]